MENALIDQPAAALDRDPPRVEPTASARAPSRWKVNVRNLTLIGLLLGASGGYRYWRDHQFASLEARHRDSPFALKEISAVLGSWRQVEGAETTLDPRIARLAGSSDHVVRTYRNEETGERASVLVIYGPALLVFGHTPEICYPSTGFKPVADQEDVMIAGIDGAPDAPFRHGRYGRSEAGATQVNEVFHSFRNGGSWSPEMGSRWKQFRYNPGMFKIQVDRVASDADPRGESVHDMLAALVAEIEGRLRAGAAAPASD